ncbi:hypothetical protein ACUWC1_29650, partial [Klebsiella pneumoniae]
PNSQIISGAMSREQAAIVFNLAVKMINLNPALQPLVHIIPSGKRLVGKPCNVEYKALAAEGKTTHGLSPEIVLVHQLAEHVFSAIVKAGSQLPISGLLWLYQLLFSI